MIKDFLTGAALFLSVSVQAQQEFIIQGNIKGLEDGAVITLFRSDGQVMSSIAQDTVRNETFRFQKETIANEPEALMIASNDKGFPSTWLDVWVAPNVTTTISGNNKLLRSWYVASSIKEQVELNHYADACRELTDQEQSLFLKINDLATRGRSDQTPEQEKAEIKKQFASTRKEIDSIRSIASGKEIEIMKQSPVSTIWIKKLNGLGREVKLNKTFKYKEDVIALYNRLSDAEKSSPAGREITIFLYPPVTVKVGDTMADTDLYDLDGKLHHLSEYKGSYMLLDFWSRGCGPCIMALPEMKEISEAEKGRVTLISLSTDPEKGWKEVSKTKDMPWVNLNDFGGMSGLAAKYGVSGIPHYVIISPEGKILHAWSGYSPGLLKRKLRRWTMASDRVMSVKQEGNVTCIDFPTEKSSNTESIEINKIVLDEAATTLHVKAYNAPGYWISISPETYLKATDGTRYTLKSGEGITPGEQLTMPESGEQEFKLIFPPLPAGTKSIDFIESDCESCFKVLGLALTK